VIHPPFDLEPNLTVAWIALWAMGIATVLSVAHAVFDWRVTRSPMLWMLLLGGATVGPFAIEPTYDIVMATWYPSDLPFQIATVAGRPMALMIPLTYVAGISWTCYLAFRMVMAGASVRTMVLTFGALSLIEGIGEMTLSHFGVMRYYGNHATIFDVPLPTLVQNAGMFPIIGVALAMLVPHLRGWRWLVVPFVPYCLYTGYVLGCTWPNFLAIHGQAAPALFWALALLSCALNGLAAWGALHVPTAVQLRHSRGVVSPLVTEGAVR
jgi:hypothetical protein